MSPSTRQIPWLRVFVEGVVIVGSILLAFGIDAWWEEKELGREIRQDLASVKRELDANVELAEFQIEVMERMVVGSESLLSSMEAAIGQEVVSTPDTLAFWAQITPTYQPALGALDALIASGRLSAIDDADLRLRLAGLPALVQDAVELQPLSRDRLFYDQMMPLLNKAAGYDSPTVIQVGATFLAAGREVGRPLESNGFVDYPNTQPLRALIAHRRFLSEITITEMVHLVDEMSALGSLIDDYTRRR